MPSTRVSLPATKEIVLLASTARTATVSTAAQTNEHYRGVRITVNCTASADTPSVVFTVEARDPVATSTWTAILTSAAVTGAAHLELKVYPGVTVAANVAVSEPLPKTWRVTATHADTDSITYSVAATYVP